MQLKCIQIQMRTTAKFAIQNSIKKSNYCNYEKLSESEKV